MGIGRIALAAAAMLWLASPVRAAPGETDAAGGRLLADGADLALETSGVASDSIDRVGGGFVASSWRPGTLGDPDALIEQAVVDAVDRGHRRVSAADLDADAADGHPTLDQLDSGWDDFGTLTPEHQLRRLRQLANLLAERAPTSERLLEFEARAAPARDVTTVIGRSDEGLFIRNLKDALKSVQNGTFFTPERIALGVAFLLAVGMLTRLRPASGR
jgi:hypothetical protein